MCPLNVPTTNQLKQVRFVNIPSFECLFYHPEHQTIVSVYVLDFKMAGETWPLPGPMRQAPSNGCISTKLLFLQSMLAHTLSECYSFRPKRSSSWGVCGSACLHINTVFELVRSFLRFRSRKLSICRWCGCISNFHLSCKNSFIGTIGQADQ